MAIQSMLEELISDLKSRNGRFYQNQFANDEHIAEDAAIIAKRMETLDAIPEVRVGDFLRLKDGTVARMAENWGDAVQPSSGGRDGGSFYLADTCCDYSGAYGDLIPVSRLKLTNDSMRGMIWIFHRDIWGPGRRIQAMVPFRVYEECSPGTVAVQASTAKWFYDDLSADYASGGLTWREITRENYLYAFNVVPPLDMTSDSFLCGEPYDHIGTGEGTDSFDAVYAGFVKIRDRHFGRLIPRKQFQEAVAALRAFIGSSRELR